MIAELILFIEGCHVLLERPHGIDFGFGRSTCADFADYSHGNCEPYA